MKKTIGWTGGLTMGEFALAISAGCVVGIALLLLGIWGKL